MSLERAAAVSAVPAETAETAETDCSTKIRGHGFEPHALLDWVVELWINEQSKLGQPDDARLLNDLQRLCKISASL
ncbi:hypothetical protein PENPOL_c006G04985 [Penicillium polonicum]|uniref:Uncharacterized protein n=1 Tax=Penicillium polonicum TaxID=60169 RepID=A0A1V6NKK9_PENPO|nr:hypothetical protein PENPOL_c006G04985 [Penicillium polonicum]